MSDLRSRLAASLDGPDVECIFECAHCGVDNERWREDCPRCGGVLMRIVTDAGNDDAPTLP